MGLWKKGDIYYVTRTTNIQSNILAIRLGDANTRENDIEVIDWESSNITRPGIRTSKEELLRQVFSGLKRMNGNLGTNYTIAAVYYISAECSDLSMYDMLTGILIRNYHQGGEFKNLDLT
jgi:hypothetical protein